VRLTLENVRRTIDDLTARRESREKELLAMRHVVSATPVVAGGALVIPAGLLAAQGPAGLDGGRRRPCSRRVDCHEGRDGRRARTRPRSHRRVGAEVRLGRHQFAKGH
jgi:hypothetical protein